jgi:ATP-dependent Lon protease
MDETYIPVTFSFKEKQSGKEYLVKTLEEAQYPEFFDKQVTEEEGPDFEEREPSITTEAARPLESGKHVVIMENQKGISFEKLFADYLRGSSSITVYDPYIRHFYQVKNLSDFIQMVLKIKPVGEEVDVKLVTKRENHETNNQEGLLSRLQDNLDGSGINFTYEYDGRQTFHARSIVTDTGWKILLDRGLDLFQQYDYNDAFCLANNIQEERLCKACEVTFVRNEESEA